MKKPLPKKSTAKKKTFGNVKLEVELEEGAWAKFEAMIRRAAKMGHKPHKAKPGKS